MQVPEKRQACLRMMITITRTEDKKRLEEVLDDLEIPVCYQCRGEGTAPSEILDIFGLSGGDRLLTACILPKARTKEVFGQLSRRLPFRHRGGGIGITVPVTGLQNRMLQMLTDNEKQEFREALRRDEAEMKERSMYSVIWVSAVSGCSDDVIDTARAAGAKGGTVLHGRRRSSEKAQQYLGLPMQGEQEFIMIVVEKEKKCTVMKALNEACGLKTPVRGVILSLPVDDVMGLE